MLTGDCQCHCSDKKRRRKLSTTPKPPDSTMKLDQLNRDSVSDKVENISLLLQENNHFTDHAIHRIPVVTNMQTDHIPHLPCRSESAEVTTSQSQTGLLTLTQPPMTPKTTVKESDDLMQQMEKLFQGDKDEDDWFTSTLMEDNSKTLNGINTTQDSLVGSTQDYIGTLNSTKDFMGSTIIENHAAQIKYLDERLSTLTGLLVSNEPPQDALLPPIIQKKQKHATKWHCEEYFLKKNLFELLYQIGDNNRQKLARVIIVLTTNIYYVANVNLSTKMLYRYIKNSNFKS